MKLPIIHTLVRTKSGILALLAVVAVVSTIALAALGRFGASTRTSDIPVNQQVKVTGVILSRDGDMVRIKDKKSGQFVIVNITDNTKIERKKHRFLFPRQTDMDVTAMVPGLTIEAEAVRNAKGQLDAVKISFTPDQFAIKNAREQQVAANKAEDAHGTAHRGTATAGRAQSSAEHAQNSADQPSLQAQDVAPLESADATNVSKLNHRVSDLDDYKNEFELDVFFGRDSAVLNQRAKKDVDNLADIARSLDGYLIEIAGYTSNTLGTEVDQKLSEDRAAAVAGYFREKDIPIRRILIPVGYGATHPAVSNKDLRLRELNDRVDIKILVNKSLG
jgi:outer membrane protein OmpA-like peptidoglycan-associated protein